MDCSLHVVVCCYVVVELEAIMSNFRQCGLMNVSFCENHHAVFRVHICQPVEGNSRFYDWSSGVF